MLEVEMVQGMNTYFEKYGIKYTNEVRMGIGIPDIVFNIGGNSRIKKLDDFAMFEILEYINNKRTTTFKEIVNRFRFEMSKVKKYIYYLEEICVVKIKEQVIKVIKNIFNTNLGTVISIEAKLRDWKSGLLQAQRYLSFSDYSYLALPYDKIRNVELQPLEDKGIGLLSIDGGKIIEVLQPRISTVCNYKFKYLATSEILLDNANEGRRRRKDKIFFGYT